MTLGAAWRLHHVHAGAARVDGVRSCTRVEAGEGAATGAGVRGLLAPSDYG